MSNHSIKSGNVYYLNLSDHSGSSKKVMKDPHFVTIISNDRLLSNPRIPYAICVPMTSFKMDIHWDNIKGRLRYGYFHHLIEKSKYPSLESDTIIKCDQIFTIDSELYTNFRFSLEKDDIEIIRRKIAFILGYGPKNF